ncbi:MAG: DUF45 domain-containing protein [Nitriliruptorales bacterium]|nr:DUF45 domain-containing protein [Nitriliruptorales bacterium]
MDVEVVRSPRRRKTVEARQVGDVLRVSIPATMTPEEEAHWVERMRRRFERRRRSTDIELPARARSLAERLGLPYPEMIRWVENQRRRWGSCTPTTGTIRLSTRLAEYPQWVVDYVIVHELAHLVEPYHDAAFWSLVSRYPRTERARGFLIAKGLEPDE